MLMNTAALCPGTLLPWADFLTSFFLCRSRSAHEEAAEVRMRFRLNGRFSCQRRLQRFGVWRVTITASTVVWPYLGQPLRHAPPATLLSGSMDWAILANSSFRVITISESCFCPVGRRCCLETFDLVLFVSTGTFTRMIDSFRINCHNGRDMVGMTARSRLNNRSNLPRRTEDLAGVLEFLLGC